MNVPHMLDMKGIEVSMGESGQRDVVVVSWPRGSAADVDAMVDGLVRGLQTKASVEERRSGGWKN